MVKIFRVAALAAMALLASTAQADVRWYVTGTFSDGAILSGWFEVNQYANFDAGNVVTSDGTAFAGQDYTPPGLSTSSDPLRAAFFEDSYAEGLNLVFTSDLTVGAAHNDLLTTSFECRTFCPAPAADYPASYRYLTSGYASTNAILLPEPASWAMLILGFGLTGAMLRRQRAKAIA